MTLTARQWQAIQHNDATFDNQFWYAVKTTGIFCRPSCPSRLPKPEHITIFKDPKDALTAGYRPCKRCRPLNQLVANELWVQEIDHVLAQDYPTKLTLAELAAKVHGSASYVRHVYQDLTGLTPQQKLTQLRLTRAKVELLQSNASVASIGAKVGLPNTPYFIQRFKARYGQTPHQYRLHHGD